MGPARLNRPEIQRRMADTPSWIVDELLDAFELPALAAKERAAALRPRPAAPGAAAPAPVTPTPEGSPPS